MTQATVVVEGPSDQTLLSRLLQPEIESGRVRITHAGGKSAAESLARSVLALRRGPVVLVVDADTTDERTISDQRLYYREALPTVRPDEGARVVIAAPALEYCLFHDRDIAARVFGVEVSDVQMVEAAYAPSKVLLQLSKADSKDGALAAIAEGLTEADVGEVRASAPIREILQAIEDVTTGQPEEAVPARPRD